MKKLSELSTADKEKLFEVLSIELTCNSYTLGDTPKTKEYIRTLLQDSQVNLNELSEEGLEIIGLAKAYETILKEPGTQKNITVEFIKNLHKQLYSYAYEITQDPEYESLGTWRDKHVVIDAELIPYAHYEDIESELEGFIHKFDDEPMTMYDIADFHIELQRIRPFLDGNGRVGRLVMAYQAVQNDIVPPLIEDDDLYTYIEAMTRHKMLELFLQESVGKSLRVANI